MERVRAKCFINEILADVKCLFRIPEYFNFNWLTFHSQSSKNVAYLDAEKDYPCINNLFSNTLLLILV